jgi:hypothetical protein
MHIQSSYSELKSGDDDIKDQTHLDTPIAGGEMTGSKNNPEGNSSDIGEPGPGPYWKRMHRDWLFWVGAVFMAAALAIYVLSGDLAWVPWPRTN